MGFVCRVDDGFRVGCVFIEIGLVVGLSVGVLNACDMMFADMGEKVVVFDLPFRSVRVIQSSGVPRAGVTWGGWRKRVRCDGLFDVIPG